MLKNWLVKTKQIKNKEKGFINHINYLSDEKRSSHYYSKIVILNNTASNILKAFDDRKAYRQKNGLRGGGVSNYATTFIMSLPRDIKQPNELEWKKISAHLVKDLAEANNIEVDKMKEHCHIVLHDESSSDNKPSHIHVVVSNVIDNQVIKSISQYKSTDTVKKSFNRSVKAVIGVDNNKYQPKQENVTKMPYWAFRQQIAKKAERYIKAGLKAKELIAESEKAKKIIEIYDSVKSSFVNWLVDIKTKNSAELSANALADDVVNMYENDDVTALKVDMTIEKFEVEEKVDEPEKVSLKVRKRRRRK